MPSVTITALFVYPIKSTRGIAVPAARVGARGFVGDRRFMVVDADGVFMTQRRYPRMALADVTLAAGAADDGGEADHALRVGAAGVGAIAVPARPSGPTRDVRVWKDTCPAVSAGSEAAAFFSELLGVACELVFMPDATHRAVDTAYATAPDQVVSFADGFPYLIASTASLDDLNARLPEPVPMLRFRPNIVVSGGAAFAEDAWRAVHVGGIRFDVVKPCSRCVLVNVDPATGTLEGKEPLATLTRYRATNGKVYFGQNAVARNEGLLKVGDTATS